jgi:hypothetical protein
MQASIDTVRQSLRKVRKACATSSRIISNVGCSAGDHLFAVVRGFWAVCDNVYECVLLFLLPWYGDHLLLRDFGLYGIIL